MKIGFHKTASEIQSLPGMTVNFGEECTFSRPTDFTVMASSVSKAKDAANEIRADFPDANIHVNVTMGLGRP